MFDNHPNLGIEKRTLLRQVGIKPTTFGSNDKRHNTASQRRLLNNVLWYWDSIYLMVCRTKKFLNIDNQNIILIPLFPVKETITRQMVMYNTRLFRAKIDYGNVNQSR